MRNLLRISFAAALSILGLGALNSCNTGDREIININSTWVLEESHITKVDRTDSIPEMVQIDTTYELHKSPETITCKEDKTYTLVSYWTTPSVTEAGTYDITKTTMSFQPEVSAPPASTRVNNYTLSYRRLVLTREYVLDGIIDVKEIKVYRKQ